MTGSTGNNLLLILQREIKSGNAFAYSHWRKRSADKAAWVALVRSEMAKLGFTPGDSARFCRVCINSFRKRKMDDDNLIAGAKHLRDSLISAGLIADDSEKWATFYYHQCFASDWDCTPHTRVFLSWEKR